MVEADQSSYPYCDQGDDTSCDDLSDANQLLAGSLSDDDVLCCAYYEYQDMNFISRAIFDAFGIDESGHRCAVTTTLDAVVDDGYILTEVSTLEVKTYCDSAVALVAGATSLAAAYLM